jgi:hypothetical protein
MNKLLVASAACLLSISMSSIVRAEDNVAAQDPFGEAEEAQVVAEAGADDPFGDFGSEARGRGRGTGRREAPSIQQQREAHDANDPFGRAAERRGPRGMGMGRGGEMHRYEGEAAGMVRVEELANYQRQLHAASARGTFTVVTADKRSILLNTSTGDSWTLMIDNTGSRWEPIKMPVAGEDASNLGAKTPEVEEATVSLGREVKADEMKESLIQALRRNSQMTTMVDQLNQQVANLEKRLKEAQEATARDAQAEIIDASENK